MPSPADLHFELIDREATPLGELTLHRYTAPDGEQGYEVRIDGAFLMATHGAMGEVHMAPLAWEAHPEPREGLHVLVGGLGAGHTLRAVLDLPGVTRVTVAELGAKVVAWNRRYFAVSNGGAVDDPRVEVVVGDLALLLARSREAFDLMLLDVDNGPGWLAAPGNARLYRSEGVDDCLRALRTGGVLAVWSPSVNEAFRHTLRARVPAAREVPTGTLDDSGERGEDVIYLAERPAL
jgi:spermidine synthase